MNFSLLEKVNIINCLGVEGGGMWDPYSKYLNNFNSIPHPAPKRRSLDNWREFILLSGWEIWQGQS